MAREATRFEVWTVGTVTVVTVGLVGVVLGHASGALADTLPGLGTLPGVAVFGYLWMLALLATRWALADGGLATAETDLGRLVARGAAASALAGMGFLLGPIIVVGGYNLTTAPITGSPSDALSVLAVVLIGLGVAGVVGLVLGALLTLLNAGLYAGAGKLVGAKNHARAGERDPASRSEPPDEGGA
jgi:hypothetical protein